MNHNVASPLEDIHLHASDPGDVGEDEKVGIKRALFLRFIEKLPSFGIVARHCANQRKLNAPKLLLHQPVGLDNPHWVFPRVEARHLKEERAIRVHAAVGDRAFTQVHR